MKVNWGILGVANISEKLVQSIQDSTEGVVKAVASRNKEKAKKFAERHGIEKYYGNYDDLLKDKEVSAIYNPLPNHLHKEWTIKAAAQKKHVLCEKPFALTSEEAKEIFEICKENESIVMEAFMYRFDPKISKLKELLKQGTIGEIKYIDFNFSHPIEEEFKKKDNYRLRKNEGGGALYDLGVYGISLSNYLLESKVNRILYSKAIKQNKEDIDRTIFLKILYNGNIICDVTASFQFSGNYVILSGTKGIIEVTNIISQDEGELRIKKSWEKNIVKEKFEGENSYKLMINHFNDCILNNNELEITREQTIGVLEVVEKVFHSMERII